MEQIHQRFTDQAVREHRFWCKDTLIDMQRPKINDLGVLGTFGV